MEPMLTKPLKDLCVAHKSKCLFTKSLKNEVISKFQANTKKNFEKEDFWKICDFICEFMGKLNL